MQDRYYALGSSVLINESEKDLQKKVKKLLDKFFNDYLYLHQGQDQVLDKKLSAKNPTVVLGMEWVSTAFSVRQNPGVHNNAVPAEEFKIPAGVAQQVPIDHVQIIALRTSYSDRGDIWIPFTSPVTKASIDTASLALPRDMYYKKWARYDKGQGVQLEAVIKFYETYTRTITHPNRSVATIGCAADIVKKLKSLVKDGKVLDMGQIAKLHCVGDYEPFKVTNIDLAVYLAIQMYWLSIRPVIDASFLEPVFNEKGDFAQRTNFLITQLTDGKYVSAGDLMAAVDDDRVNYNNNLSLFNPLAIIIKSYETYTRSIRHPNRSTSSIVCAAEIVKKLRGLLNDDYQPVAIAVFLAQQMQALELVYPVTSANFFTPAFNPNGNFSRRTNFWITELTDGKYVSANSLLAAVDRSEVEYNNLSLFSDDEKSVQSQRRSLAQNQMGLSFDDAPPNFKKNRRR